MDDGGSSEEGEKYQSDGNSQSEDRFALKNDEKWEEVDKGNFPIVVVESLCSSQIQGTSSRFPLNRLASICSDLKSWVKVPKVLSDCQIEVESEAEIESILLTKESLQWNNICMKEETYIGYKNFARFASQLGPTILHLKLHKFFGSIPEISFISCCTSLKSLVIIQLDVTRSPRMLMPSEFPNLSRTFGGVKLLAVESIYFNNYRQLEFFKNFLNRFPKLEHLSIPQPNGTSVGTEWEFLKCLQSKYLVKPVLDYLSERHNNLNLPVNPIRRTVDVTGVFSNVFPELAIACVKNGAFLTSVNQKQIQNLFLSQDTTLGKILSINESLNDQRLLVRWYNLEKVSLNSSACDIRTDNFSAKSVIFPQLKSIRLLLDSDSKTDPQFYSLSRLLKLLIGLPRLGVKDLYLHWPPYGHDTPPDVVNARLIVKNLPNLTKLHLSCWKAWDEDLLVLLDGLQRLQHLAIEDCPLFTELGILGPEKEFPSICNLQSLKNLEIVNRTGSGSITDTSFQRAFQHMPLTAFVFDSNPNLVTIEGYTSLHSGVFGETIEIFPEPRNLPKNVSQEFFLELRDRFKKFQNSSA